MPDGGMGQQLLGVAPQQLLPHLRLEVVEGVEVLHPALGHDEGIIRAEEEAVLQARGRFAQQGFGNVFR